METKMRVYGEDRAFNDWLRTNPRLPSRPTQGVGINISDVDSLLDIVHRYYRGKNRNHQQLMFLETKRRDLSQWDEKQFQKECVNQLDTLSKLHLCNKGDRVFEDEAGEKHIRNYGVSILVMDADTPPEATGMLWGRFKWTSQITIFDQLHWVKLQGVQQLEKLLRFEISPDFGLHGDNNG